VAYRCLGLERKKDITQGKGAGNEVIGKRGRGTKKGELHRVQKRKKKTYLFLEEIKEKKRLEKKPEAEKGEQQQQKKGSGRKKGTIEERRRVSNFRVFPTASGRDVRGGKVLDVNNNARERRVRALKGGRAKKRESH